jgi:hypothetical protein
MQTLLNPSKSSKSDQNENIIQHWLILCHFWRSNKISRTDISCSNMAGSQSSLLPHQLNHPYNAKWQIQFPLGIPNSLFWHLRPYTSYWNCGSTSIVEQRQKLKGCFHLSKTQPSSPKFKCKFNQDSVDVWREMRIMREYVFGHLNICKEPWKF